MNARGAGGPARLNVASRLRESAERYAAQTALVFPTGKGADGTITYGQRSFGEVERDSDAYARGLRRLGIGRGTKTIVMVKSSPELYAVLFALFKLGAVPVIVDPGMGIRNMVACYASVGAEAFIGIPLAHAVRLLFPSSFATLKTLVTVGTRRLGGGQLLSEAYDAGDGVFPIEPTNADDLIIVNFTSGSTGPRRGVECTHGMVDAMVRAVEASFAQTPADVSLVTIPFIALFNLLLRSTSVLAPMDQAKPALVDARAVIDAIQRFGVTLLFGSPAFLHRVASHAKPGDALPSIRAAIAGGAPVHRTVLDGFRALLGPDAELHTTYGATEALPIASIEARAIVGETRAATARGLGTCVGRPLGSVSVRIVRITEEPMPTFSPELLVGRGEVGEIVIEGPIVSRRYHRAPEADARTKVRDGERIWHRTGDLGALDDEGRLWFHGRKSQRVLTANGPAFTVAWEGIFNQHPRVYRSALVGVGEPEAKAPVMCVELRHPEGVEARRRILDELRALAEKHTLARDVKAFLFHPGFPVDVRHNAKIGREALARWATRELSNAERGSTGLLLHVVPILGWVFIVAGALRFSWLAAHPVLLAVWYVDLFLSVVAHALQVPAALRRARAAGHSDAFAVFMTFLLGATWWKRLVPLELQAPPHRGEGRA